MLASDDRSAAQAIARLCVQNPFGPLGAELQRAALGPDHREDDPDHNQRALSQRAVALLEQARKALAAGHARDAEDTELYQGLVRYGLLVRLETLFRSLSQACHSAGLMLRRVSSYRLFLEEAERLLSVPGEPLPLRGSLPHLFAILFQVRRARFFIETQLQLGESRAALELRAAVWHAVFTQDMARYERVLYRQMARLPVLVGGPPGTPKAAVARIIGLSGYVAFDAERMRFTSEPAMAFRTWEPDSELPSLQDALSPARGPAESGDREGRAQPALKASYWILSDVDAMATAAQGKLLGLLSSWLGVDERDPGVGVGPRAIATSRGDLAEAVREGSFREDLYYLLAAHRLDVPALSTQLRQRPADLRVLVARALTPLLEGQELKAAVEEVVAYIEKKLAHHTFPGNQRELAQCARAVLIDGEYRPLSRRADHIQGPLDDLGRRFVAGDFDVDGLLDVYCTLMYGRTGSYQESARRLGIDRRTVKSRVNEALLAELT